MRLVTRGLVPAALVAACASTSFGAVVFQDNFNTNTSAAWTVNSAGSNAATFAYDYSTQGIPAAPHSAAGSTLGLKLEPNYKGGGAAFAPFLVPGLSLSPIGQSFTGDYTLTADIWFNYPVTGSGSTQFGGMGIGTSGTATQVAGAASSAYVIASYDGGTSQDYRVYVPSAQSGLTTTTGPGVYAAGSQSSANTYYTTAFPKPTAPAYQTSTAVNPLAENTGAAGVEYNNAGQLGFAWYTWTLAKAGNTISWSVTSANGTTTTPLATYTLTTADINGLGGTNILLSSFDGSGTASADPNARDILFMLVDNIQVTAVPEPASLSLLGLGSLALLKRRRNA